MVDTTLSQACHVGCHLVVTRLLLPWNQNCKQTWIALSHACTALWEDCTTL